MSHSPAASISNSSESVPKKRKTTGQGDLSMSASSQQQSHIPKRGARACTSCRKGKNRCEGEVRTVFLMLLSLTEARQYRSRPGSLSTASLSSLPGQRYSLHFRKAREKKCSRIVHSKCRVCLFFCISSSSSSCLMCHRRLSRLEGQYLVLPANCLQSLLNPYRLLFQVMQSQMIGMQSSLDRILSAVQTQNGNAPQLYTPMEAHRDGNPITHRNGFDAGPAPAVRSFPPLPGFAPPVSLVFRPSLY